MKCLGLLLVSGLAAGSAVAADGVYQKDDGSTSWSNVFNWQREVVPGEGGVAYFPRGHAPATLNLDQDVTLGGLSVDSSRNTVWTNDSHALTFSRNESVLLFGGESSDLRVQVRGTGANRLLKCGGSSVTLRSPVADAVSFGIAGGRLNLTDSTETQLHRTNFRLIEGELRNAAGGTAGLPATTYGIGRSRVRVNGSSIAFASLTRENGTLTVIPENGLTALGETEKVLVADAPTPVNGMVDASITVFDYTRNQPQYYGNFFATYVAEKGFLPVLDGVPYDAAADQSDQIVRLKNATTLADAARFHALYLDSTVGTLTLGRTLTVGDGVHPAGILVNDISGDAFKVTLADGGAGRLSFGDAPGVIWTPTYGHDNMEVVIDVPIEGTKGVTFAGAPGYRSGADYPRNTVVYLKRDATWSAPTVISGTRLVLSNANQLPEGDVYFTGYDACGMGCLRHTSSLTFNENYRFHFSGSGFQNKSSSGGGVIHLGGGNGVTTTINGTVELRDISSFSHDSEKNYVVLNGTVYGTGGLYLCQGYLVLGGVNTFSGDVTVSSAATLVVREGGTLGTGRVSGGGKIRFENCADLTVDTPVSCTGTVTFDGGHVILSGGQTFAKTELRNGAVVEVGPDVDLGAVSATGASVVKPLAGNAKTADLVGDGSDYTLNDGVRYDASAKLVKSGANTVTLTAGTVNGGSLQIYGGTVRLNDSYMALDSCTFWMDASQDATVSTNDAGGVTGWVSANGTGATFSNYGTAPTYTTAPNGLGAMRMKLDNEHYNRFHSTARLRQRTLFLCLSPEKPTPSTGKFGGMMSAWGRLNQSGESGEHGLRYEDFSGGWGKSAFAKRTQRMNGTTDRKFTLGSGMQVVTLVSTNTYDMYTGLGGYETWGADKMFNGLFCEAIAFDVELDETTVKQIENYLAVKWGVNAGGFDPSAGCRPGTGANVLGPTTELALAAGATFDLNGVDQTVASLRGCGSIVNTASTPAKLTVAGDCDFGGTIGAGVTLVKAGEGADTLAGTVAGSLAVEKGSLEVVKHLDQPPTDGLIFWLDAATATKTTTDTQAANTFVVNANGRITRWYTRQGTLSHFTNWSTGPQYSENGFRGKFPAIFYNENCSLIAASAVSPRTFAIIWWVDRENIGTSIYANYILGCSGNTDSGWRLRRSDNYLEMYANSEHGFCSSDDRFYLNGVKTTPASTVDCGVKTEPVIAIGTRAAWHTRGWTDVKPILGNYCTWNYDQAFYIGEVLAWDRELTEAEVRQVDKYLRDRWCGDARPQETGSLASGILTVKGGATVDFSEVTATATPTLALTTDAAGGTIAGDATVSSFAYDAKDATDALPLNVTGDLTITEGADFTATGLGNLRRTSWTLLTSGSATGEFDGFSAGPRKWAFKAGDASWGISPFGFLLQLK